MVKARLGLSGISELMAFPLDIAKEKIKRPENFMLIMVNQNGARISNKICNFTSDVGKYLKGIDGR